MKDFYEENKEKYLIEASLFNIARAVGNSIHVGHYFWTLKNANGELLAQLHGFATSRRTGAILPVGYTSDHSLRAHHLIFDEAFAEKYKLSGSPPYNLPTHWSQVVYREDNCLDKWKKAVSYIPAINALDLDYSRFGIGTNSNSMYCLFGRIMDVQPVRSTSCVKVDVGFDRSIPLHIEVSPEESKIYSLAEKILRKSKSSSVYPEDIERIRYSLVAALKTLSENELNPEQEKEFISCINGSLYPAHHRIQFWGPKYRSHINENSFDQIAYRTHTSLEVESNLRFCRSDLSTAPEPSEIEETLDKKLQ